MIPYDNISTMLIFLWKDIESIGLVVACSTADQEVPGPNPTLAWHEFL